MQVRGRAEHSRVPSVSFLQLGLTRPAHISIARATMNGLIYLIGLIVVVMAILSFLGLH
jgi:hypothetical protein